ncbi:hypothetical protein [Phreatobacter stygius]|uniref:CPBP family intramembrane metalloprotease n=1 Tax=Phreatobacter stygius TaxID=1940610 RepID=A0A4D7AYU9_9HYPH|nr:hypothetical protein [Phreatobacter stygius]QCI62850.1 hypothetical protein E8M01_00475 [Phreatobacter stygius]
MTSVLRWIGEPGERPWLKAISIGAALLAVPLAWWSVLWLTPYRPPVPEASPLTIVIILLAAVIASPLLETAVLAMVHWLAVDKLRLAVPLFVAVLAAIAVAAHMPITLARAPVTAVLFLVFAWQYAGWFARSGRRWFALGAVALTHAVYNLGSIGLSPVWAFLLRPSA